MADEKKKTGPQARLARGFVDRGPAEIAATERMLATIRQVYELYGFEAVETPAVEFTDALGKFLPDLDRPNEGVFSFQDDDEQWLSLRYDLTAPLARYVAENFDKLPKPYRSYRAGYVFRNEKPGPGRFRQFMQFDADTVGSASPAADAENCMMFADAMEALGIERGQYVVKVNSRKVLDGVMEAIGLGGEENAGRRLTVLRAIDKFDKFGAEGVKLLLGPGRKDESGDFTKGAGLGDEQIQRMLAYCDAGIRTWEQEYTEDIESDEVLFSTSSANERMFGLDIGIVKRDFFTNNSRQIDYLRSLVPDSETAVKGLDELSAISDLCRSAGFYADRIRIDPSVVRGLEYYTGAVYEVELTFPVVNEDGLAVRFGSVGGGGRYDGLIGRFRAEDVPATGISVGVSRLAAALKALGRFGVAEPLGPVVTLVMDRDNLAGYQQIVAALRSVGVRAEVYLGASGMKAQMKYADRRNAPCVIIQGSDERAKGVVVVKDLAAGAEAAEAAKSIDVAAYKALRPAQIEVPYAPESPEALIAAVKEIVARRAGG